MGVGHSSQTRSFAPAASLARVRLRNFCLRKRPSFLASRRFAYGITDTHGNDKFGINNLVCGDVFYASPQAHESPLSAPIAYSFRACAIEAILLPKDSGARWLHDNCFG